MTSEAGKLENYIMETLRMQPLLTWETSWSTPFAEVDTVGELVRLLPFSCVLVPLEIFDNLQRSYEGL